jgi:hypothetical protein
MEVHVTIVDYLSKLPRLLLRFRGDSRHSVSRNTSGADPAGSDSRIERSDSEMREQERAQAIEELYFHSRRGF